MGGFRFEKTQNRRGQIMEPAHRPGLIARRPSGEFAQDRRAIGVEGRRRHRDHSLTIESPVEMGKQIAAS